MNGIFPDYIGPRIENRFESLYPDWIGSGLFDVEAEAFEGGGGKSTIEALERSAHGRRLLKEDQEIMAVIMVAMRVLQ